MVQAPAFSLRRVFLIYTLYILSHILFPPVFSRSTPRMATAHARALQNATQCSSVTLALDTIQSFHRHLSHLVFLRTMCHRSSYPKATRASTPTNTLLHMSQILP